MATTYATIADYITENIAPGIGVELTDEQATEVAQRMTKWTVTRELVERDDVDFWDVVADVLGDK